MTVKLGVNIDHIATLRQARGVGYPDPVAGAMLAVDAGADGITLHLREDRRHIQDDDVRRLKKMLTVPMNLEMAATDEMIKFACDIKPEHCCLVPEKREELTTEGGLDVASQISRMIEVCRRLAEHNIEVSLFIDPSKAQIEAAKQIGAPTIELHTGEYANAEKSAEQRVQRQRIEDAAQYAASMDLIVNAGHGLTVDNVAAIAKILTINELNIGHSIIARAVFIGLKAAVQEIKALI